VSTAKKSSKASAFQPTQGHKTSFQTGFPDTGVIDAFGKVVDPSPISGLAAGQQLALVFGIRENGKCTQLPAPQHVALPAPDGPADGCGWDPTQFVVWKNLAKTLITTHVQARSVSLQDALKPATSAALLTPEPTVDDVLHQWLSQSVPGQPIPDVDQLQVAWATFGSGGAFTVQVQQNLANLLNDAFFGSNVVVPANLPGTLTVGQLKLNLHRSA
jgi:hypothetical protein